MRQIFCALCLVALNPAFSSAQAVQAKPAVKKASTPPAVAAGMTNSDVIKMVKAGLNEDIILGAIQSAPKKSFNLLADGLIELKSSGASDRLIIAMQNDGRVPIATPPPPASPTRDALPTLPAVHAAAVDDVKKPHDAGIYALLAGKLQPLEPTVATSAGTGLGNMAVSGLTMGIKKVKIKASIRGNKAQVRVDPVTEFYFYSSSLFNPNEYVLAKLESGSDNREIVIGEGGLLGSRGGVRDEDQIKTTVTRLDNGIYKVVPARDLKSGEYGFIALGNSTNQKLWDFGIDR